MRTKIRNSEERSDSIDGNGTRPTASRAAAPWRGAQRLAPPDAPRRETERVAALPAREPLRG
ncbi:hypothetical protein, partial [Rhodococcus qingshengii]|uniref:hypothetical protein n=1 Tax=Rhodococcus qingshengii TaxID=334542 RepID=UPI001C5F9E64